MSEEDIRQIGDMAAASCDGDMVFYVPELIAEIRHLRALLGAAPLMLEALEANEEVVRLQKPLVDGLNSGDASAEVKQEATRRMMRAQRRWWDLRRLALAAARRRTSC